MKLSKIITKQIDQKLDINKLKEKYLGKTLLPSKIYGMKKLMKDLKKDHETSK